MFSKKALKDCGFSMRAKRSQGISMKSFCINNNIFYTAFYD